MSRPDSTILWEYLVFDENNRLEKPNDCSYELWAIIRRCWLLEANKRPSFEILHNEITQLVQC